MRLAATLAPAHFAAMDLGTTFLLALAATATTVFAGWRGSRPWDPRRGVRMVPWRLVMVLSAAAVLVLMVHVGSLLGVPQRPY